MKIIQLYSFTLGITTFTIPNLGFISKHHLEKIRHNEFCPAENIVTENNNGIFASWLNPPTNAQGHNWSSIIQKNPYLHRSNIEFCSYYHCIEPDMRVGGGLYANSDYYQPQYSKEDGIGIFKYYHYSEIKELHTDKLDLTPDCVNDHDSISKSNTKLFFTHLLNNLLNDWYWKNFSEELSCQNIPEFDDQLLLINQDWDYWTNNFDDLMYLEFGVEYNELNKVHVPINKWISIIIGAVASAVLAIITEGEGGAVMSFISSFITSAIIDFLMPYSITTRYENIHQVNRFISKSLTMTFWNNLFASLFGAPGHHKGVLLDFISRYGELPSQLHLDNFDFYLPLDSFMVGYDQLDFHNASLQFSLYTTAMRSGVDLWDLKNKIMNSSFFDWWFDYFDFYIDRFHYADENSFITVVCHELELVFPALTPDLYKYFSLSHTELFLEKKVPITLFFNEGNKYPELGISFQRTIYGKGEVLPDEKNI